MAESANSYVVDLMDIYESGVVRAERSVLRPSHAV